MNTFIDVGEVEKLFKPEYYTCVPTEFINYISLKYRSGKTIRVGRAELEKQLTPDKRQYAKVFSLYKSEDIDIIDIDLNFNEITNYLNQAITILMDNANKKGNA